MSYVKHELLANEKIIFQGRLHWIIFWKALTFAICGTGMLPLGYALGESHVVILTISAFAYFIAACLFVPAWFIRWTTEFAVTNLRVIHKTGFVSRHTEEMNIGRIEFVDVDQTILGRIFDYGTISCAGNRARY